MAKYIYSPDLYLRKGKQVRVKIYSNCKLVENYVGIIAETPRVDGGKFASCLDIVERPHQVEVKVRMENGHIKTAYGIDCYPMRYPSELTETDWHNVRKEIKLGSIFAASYENSFGIDSHLLRDMCDAFLEDCPNMESNEDLFVQYMIRDAPYWEQRKAK